MHVHERDSFYRCFRYTFFCVLTYTYAEAICFRTLPSKDNKVCVVSVIGKSRHNPFASKASVLNPVLDRDVFKVNIKLLQTYPLLISAVLFRPFDFLPTKDFLQLPVQLVPITIKVVSSNLIHGKVYLIQHYVIKVSGFLHVLRFPIYQ